MKTYKNLFGRIIDFENLLLAANKAARGKREEFYVMQFFWQLEENLWGLRQELHGQTYQPGGYSTFQIYDPKPRMISAAPFRDRVVHHALMNVIAPLFERSFIYDSYANRIGKGTHRAIRRYQQFLRQYKYVLVCDIKKYFPSIDHALLKSLIRRRIADARTLWLIDLIVDASNTQEFVQDHFPGDDLFTPIERRKGLPIGNLTSQFFANLYVDPLDHFVKEELRCPAYLRYVDDMALFGDSKSQLWTWHNCISQFLDSIRLKLHLRRSHLLPSHIGWLFLGQQVFRSHRRLSSKNVKAFKKRLDKWQKCPPPNVQQRIGSWVGHAKQANCYCLLKSLDVEPI